MEQPELRPDDAEVPQNRRAMTFAKKFAVAGAVLISSSAFIAPTAAADPANSSAASPISVFVTDGDVGAAAYSDCPTGRICVYAATNGGGLPGWKQFARTRPGSCTFAIIPTLVGARGYLSAYNRTGSDQKLWTNINCTGTATTIGNEGIVGNLGSAHGSIGG